MTLNMLRYFVAVAQVGSFTEAANRCFVSQPALSRAIGNLEKEIGCALLDREERKTVALTHAGEVLLVEAKRILGQVDMLNERVRRAGQGTEITLGYIAYGMLRRFREDASAVLNRMTKAGIRLVPVYGSAPEIRERLQSGELDCALLPQSCTHDLPNCRIVRVSALELRVIIPGTHPLAACKSVRMEQLRDSKFVLFDPKELPMTTAFHIGLCQQAGFAPSIVTYGHKMADVMDLAYQHGAVSIATEAYEYAQTQQIRFVPLEGTYQPRWLTLVTHERPVNPQTLRILSWIAEAFPAA